MNSIIQIKYSTIPQSNPKYTRYHHKAYILSLKQQKKKNDACKRISKLNKMRYTDAPVPIIGIDRRTGQTLYPPNLRFRAIKMTDNTSDDKIV